MNPAFAGNHKQPYLYGLVNKSRTGFEGAPAIAQFTGDLNLSKTANTGMQVLNDKAGALDRIQAKISCAYRIKPGSEEGNLRLGFSLASYITPQLNIN
jgi:hypothetical protein